MLGRERLNVAVTRARSKCVILVSTDTLEHCAAVDEVGLARLLTVVSEFGVS